MMQGTPPFPGGELLYFVDLFLRRVGPFLGFVIVVVLGVHALRWVLSSPVGEALAERIRTRGAAGRGGAGEDSPRVIGLEHQVAELHGQVAELAERLDFAERLLAERRERQLGTGP